MQLRPGGSQFQKGRAVSCRLIDWEKGKIKIADKENLSRKLLVFSWTFFTVYMQSLRLLFIDRENDSIIGIVKQNFSKRFHCSVYLFQCLTDLTFVVVVKIYFKSLLSSARHIVLYIFCG